jgi:hypothetical protein
VCASNNVCMQKARRRIPLQRDSGPTLRGLKRCRRYRHE